MTYLQTVWLTDWLSFFLHFYFYLTFSISKQYPSKNKFFHNWGLGVLPNAIYPPGTVPQSWPGLGGEYSSLWYDITWYIFFFSLLLFFWFYIDRIFYSFYIVFIDHFFLYFSYVLIFSILLDFLPPLNFFRPEKIIFCHDFIYSFIPSFINFYLFLNS